MILFTMSWLNLAFNAAWTFTVRLRFPVTLILIHLILLRKLNGSMKDISAMLGV